MSYKALLGLGGLLIAGNLVAYGVMHKPQPAPVTPPKIEHKAVVHKPPAHVVPQKPIQKKTKKCIRYNGSLWCK
jgi:hypothetical protein